MAQNHFNHATNPNNRYNKPIRSTKKRGKNRIGQITIGVNFTNISLAEKGMERSYWLVNIGRNCKFAIRDSAKRAVRRIPLFFLVKLQLLSLQISKFLRKTLSKPQFNNSLSFRQQYLSGALFIVYSLRLVFDKGQMYSKAISFIV